MEGGEKLRSISARTTQKIALTSLWVIALTVIAILVVILGYLLVKGLPYINWEFLTQSARRMGREGGILPFILGTVYLTGVGVLIAAPIAVGAAIYLTEYTRQGPITTAIRFFTETLAGIPSIIFGLFGFIFFVITLGLGWSVLSGGLTLALMILPTIVRTAEEALKSVPQAYREGSLALGATQWQTIRKVVLPSALPGILTGVILGIGRAVGETAALLLTAGSSVLTPLSPLDPARSLSVHLYILAVEGISTQKAFSTAVVLIGLVLLINLTATRFVRRLAPKH